MAIFETILKSDLKKPVQVKQLSGNLFSGDNQGNKITVEVMDNGSPATLSGEVKGYIIREDNITVEVDGTLSENKASIIFPQEAYNVVGKVCIAVKVDDITVGACTAYVYRTTTDSLIDSSDWIPSLAEIEAAAVGANKVANLTVSAEAATGSTPDAVLSETGTGSSAHKHITFKLVKGDKGNTGDIPQFSIGTISSLSHGATPTASIDNTDPEHPVLSLGIPAGASGNETIDDTAGLGDTDLVYSADKVRKELDTKALVVDVPITTPASVQSFPDGADGLPMSMTVGIEPVQDLHGYDNPWPAGGGKNLLPVTLQGLKTNNPNGTWNGNVCTLGNVIYTVETDSDYNVLCISITGSVVGARSQFLLFSGTIKAGSYTLTGCPANGSGSTYQLFVNANNVYYIDRGSGKDFTIESDTQCTANIDLYTAQNLSLKYYPMLRLSSVTDPTYAPYSNICPISGWTGANVTRTGSEDIFNATGTVPYNAYNSVVTIVNGHSITVSSLNNNVYQASKQLLSDYNLVAGKKYTLVARMKEKSETGVFRFGIRNSSNSFIAVVPPLDSETSITDNDMHMLTFTYNPSDHDSISFMANWDVARTDASVTYEDIHLYEGDVTEYSITFPSSAGTVYGGTLTVNKDGSGTLVVDRKYEIAPTSGWTKSGNTVYITRSDKIRRGVPSGAICSHYPTVTYSSSDRIAISTTLSATDFGALVGQYNASETPMQIVYELATPVTYTLTAPQVKTLLGVNNIWADTGNILSVDYPADTKLYIDKKFAELSAAITALGT